MSTMSRAALTLALAVGATAAKNSVAATSGPDTLTVGILGGKNFPFGEEMTE